MRGLCERLRAFYHFILLVIVIGLTYDDASFVTGTELHQLETYFHDTWSHISAQYINATSGCIQEAVGDGRGRGVSPPRWCRRAAIVHIENLMRSQGSATETKQSQHSLFTNASLLDTMKVPSCSYSLRSVAMSSGEEMHDIYGTEFDYVITVAVAQRNCSKQGWPIRGGSSMRVELLSNHTDAIALPSCYLSHTDRSEYVYKCLLNTKQYLSNTNSNNKCNALCELELAVTLDHERYQAFHELNGVKYGMGRVVIRTPIKELSVPIGQSPVCCNTAGTSVNTSPNTAVANNVVTTLPLHMQSQIPHMRAILDQYAAVYFIGSSHMRYLWDAVAYSYYNASAQLQEIPQHHRDEPAGNTWFIASHFSLEIPEVLQHMCNGDYVYAPSASTVKKKVAVVLETTTWDLDYLPPRNLVLFPNSSTVVMDAVKAFVHKDHTCAGYQTAVLWLNAPPIPECDQNSANTGTPSQNRKSRNLHANKQSCFDKGHRNNYATRAINEYFVQALGSQPYTESAHDKRKRTSTTQTVVGALYKTIFRSVPQYKAQPIQGLLRDHAFTSTVRLIDAYGLVYPYRNNNVCGLHYLCCKHASKRPVEMQYTPGGVAVLSAVLAALKEAL